MKNVFRVLKRDIFRLLKVPPAMVVIVALLILPSLYTWYNVRGFWNPYENTQNLSVAVVNNDEGATSDLTGDIDVGEMVTDALHENHQLDWSFPSYDEAIDNLYAGKCYAVFVIPEDFSKDLLTVTTGDFQKPDIKYYVNEKSGPISPKITDTGATTLDDTINSTFVKTVSEKAAEAIDAAWGDANDRVDAAKSQAVLRVLEAQESVDGAISAIENLENQAQNARSRITSAKSSIDTASEDIKSASDALNSLADISKELQSDYLKFSAEAVPAINNSMKSLADAYAELARMIGDLPTQDPDMQALLDRVRASADDAQAAADRYADTLANDISPAIAGGLGDLASAASSASGAVAAQETLLEQTKSILSSMDGTLSDSTYALSETSSLLNGLSDNLDTVHTDLVSIATSDVIAQALGTNELDAERVADFIGAPTRLVTETLYAPNSYGTAMAPLFMNLTFWIGAFMLMVILRQEVDHKGIKNLTLTQSYIGRYLLFAIMVVLQATICCLGLPLIGSEVTNLPALIFAGIVSSLSYLSIIYALSATLQHIGKGICIILVFAQIPGATGLYPIEMTSPFFQAIYPLLPFTYGIGAMRESICGFYGMHYLWDIVILLVYLVVFMGIGILVRPLMSNVNRMVAREIKQSGIFNGEDIEVPVRRFRLSQVIRVLTEREEYRNVVLTRYERFLRIYPRLIKWGSIVGVIVPVVLTIVFSINMTGKIIILTLWLCWLVFLFIFLVIVESMKSSIERQVRLDNMSDEDIKKLYLKRGTTEKAYVIHGADGEIHE